MYHLTSLVGDVPSQLDSVRALYDSYAGMADQDFHGHVFQM